MPLVKSRNWTEADVQEAIAKIKEEPGLWQELEKIEKTTAEFRNTEAGLRERRILAELHPNCSLNEITDLYVPVRK
jgi:hypothetical protein